MGGWLNEEIQDKNIFKSLWFDICFLLNLDYSAWEDKINS